MDGSGLLSAPPAFHIPEWTDYSSAGAPVVGKKIQTPQGRAEHAAVAIGSKVTHAKYVYVCVCACVHTPQGRVKHAAVANGSKVIHSMYVYMCA